MAFSNYEVQQINYFLGRPIAVNYLTEIKSRLDEISAIPSYGIELENRLREKLRELQQIEQQIREARKRFGIISEPNNQYRSNLELNQLYSTFNTNASNLAIELNIPIYRKLYGTTTKYSR